MEFIMGLITIMGMCYLIVGGILGGIYLYSYNVSLFMIVYCTMMIFIFGKSLFKPKAFLSKSVLCIMTSIIIIATASYLKLDMSNFYIKYSVYGLETLFCIIAIVNFILFFITVNVLEENNDAVTKYYLSYNMPFFCISCNEQDYEQYIKELKLSRNEKIFDKKEKTKQ